MIYKPEWMAAYGWKRSETGVNVIVKMDAIVASKCDHKKNP